MSDAEKSSRRVGHETQTGGLYRRLAMLTAGTLVMIGIILLIAEVTV